MPDSEAIYIYIYIYIYTHTHTYIHIHTHTYTHTHTHTQEIDRKGIGGFFGEASLVFKQTRMADVKAVGARVYKDHGNVDPTELFMLSKHDFEEVCKM